MASRKSSRPTFWLIAGPNGSGKSTLYGSERAAIYGNTAIADFARPFWIINPDMLALRIRSAERMGLRAANLEAVKRIEAWLEASINAHQSVGVETVLSTSKYRRVVRAAKRRGFEFDLSMSSFAHRRSMSSVSACVSKKAATASPSTRSRSVGNDP
jgi:predicted ABC-type ATPase